MSEAEKPKPGWYWVQDMNCSARPAHFDGNVYRNFPGEAGYGLSWNWPTFRILGRCSPPDPRLWEMERRKTAEAQQEASPS